jgi:putative transposase
LIKVGSLELVWLGVVIELESKRIVGITISKERNMFVAERLLSKIVVEYGKHLVSSDGGIWYPPQSCKFLKLQHHLHSTYEKSIIERTMQYVKDRIKECFDDYFPCKRKNCKLKHVRKCLYLFSDQYNREILS